MYSRVRSFLADYLDLHLGGAGDFTAERSYHARVFGFHSLAYAKQAPIHEVEFTAIRGPHATNLIRIFYLRTAKKDGEPVKLPLWFTSTEVAILGTVDEFENGLRIVAEKSGVQVYAVEYRLAPEWRFPTQLDEYSCVLEWLRNDGGKARGVHPDRVCRGGDSTGETMTIALSLRLQNEGNKPLRAQILPYLEARIPFDTSAASEINSGYYLEGKSTKLSILALPMCPVNFVFVS